MLQIRIKSTLIAILLFSITNIMGQRLSADLKMAFYEKDSLMVKLTLKNETTTPIYLVCGVDLLKFEDFFPDRVNYGTFIDELKYRKENLSIYRTGNAKDTIRLVIPETKQRFQVGYDGKIIDVFRTYGDLQEAYNNMKMSKDVPIPPNNTESFARHFLDLDLYNLIQSKKIAIDEVNCSFYGQTVLLKPHEKKSFNIDIGYLLLRKATYQIIFDYKTDNELFKKETSFLKYFGFQRFKGRITSDVLIVVSD